MTTRSWYRRPCRKTYKDKSDEEEQEVLIPSVARQLQEFALVKRIVKSSADTESEALGTINRVQSSIQAD